MTDMPQPSPRPADHPEVRTGRVGILLVNLGTPDAPTPAAVKRYLAEFLSDRRVVEIPPAIWQPILRGIILNTRPRKSAAAYAEIWTDKGSPLAVNTAELADALAAHFEGRAMVRYAMRYGSPSIGQRLTEMKEMGCERILIAPLYPQYSGATTGSVLDESWRALAQMRWQPAVRTLPPFHDDPAYIAALAERTRAALAQLDFTPDLLLASFHGMPERTLRLGDPYHCHCQKTARLLAERIDIPMRVTFQSRFGRAKWLEPATDAVLEALPGEGVKNVAVVAPAFVADCLETLEEIAMRGREQFLRAGGERFAYLPCLNAGNEAVELFATLAERELSGWV